jgi:hypothetical protein
MYFIPALYLLIAGSVAFISRNLLPEVLSLSLIVLGGALMLLTYRSLLFIQTIKGVLKKVEAQVLITPKLAEEFESAAQEELERILSDELEEPSEDTKKEVIH